MNKEYKVVGSYKADKKVIATAKKKCKKDGVTLSSKIESLLINYIKQ